MKRSSIRRGKPLDRGTSKLDRSTAIRAVSDRRRRRDATYDDARDAIRGRCADRCEAIATVGCTGQYEQAHHRRGRVGPDPHRADNLLAVCGPCHAHIHAHPSEARERGWSVTRLTKETGQ